jgi:glycosyltransferase involved in cell wall biosynthesis
MLLLYIGKDGAAVKEKVGDFPTIAQGPFPADEVSARLAAVDIYLGPYISGTSTRRGSMMAGLQHGLPMVVTRGEHTDDMLLDMDGRALLFSDESDPEGFARQVMRLLKEPEVRERIGAGARRFYEENFTWEVIARRLLSHLTSLDHESNGDNRMPSTRASGQGSGLS